MTIPDEVDIIVAGGEFIIPKWLIHCINLPNPWPTHLGGSTGCVIAGRLANLDPNLTVLLIEGGENNLNNPWVFRPGIYPRNMKLDSRTASFYHSRPSEHLGGRQAIVPCAHVLGGGSSINFMVCKFLTYPGVLLKAIYDADCTSM